jgi:hypothetical protein
VLAGHDIDYARSVQLGRWPTLATSVQIFPVAVPGGHCGSGPGEVSDSTAPTASVETVFVQFVDGTAWGDPESAQAAFDERRETLRELGKLEPLLRDGEEQQLKDELSRRKESGHHHDSQRRIPPNKRRRR